MKTEEVSANNYTEEYFELLQRLFIERSDWSKRRIANVLRFLNPLSGDVIVDLGCGTGTFTIECAKRGAKVYGIDFSRHGLRVARKAIRNLKLPENAYPLNCSAEFLPLRDSSVDKIVCADLAEHLYPNQFLLALMESARILRDGGRIVIHTPHGTSKKLPTPLKRIGIWLLQLRERKAIPEWRRWSGWKQLQKYHFLHVHLKSEDLIRRWLRKFGFKINAHRHLETSVSILERIPVLQDFLGGNIIILATLNRRS